MPIFNKKELHIDRLHGWHNCLFEHTQYSKLNKIDIAKFRSHSDMEVISGAIGYEKVHYKAIPVEKIDKNIENFLNPDYAIGKFQSKQTYYKI